MIRRLKLIIIFACLLVSINGAFAYTCENDNKVDSEGLFCCCTPVLNTPEKNDYTCSPKTTKCIEGETPAGMKDKKGRKLCPCKIVMEHVF